MDIIFYQQSHEGSKPTKKFVFVVALIRTVLTLSKIKSLIWAALGCNSKNLRVRIYILLSLAERVPVFSSSY